MNTGNKDFALDKTSAAELASAFKSRRLSPVEVAKACLARAEAVNPHLNAFTFIAHEAALTAAKASEARWLRGEPLSEVDGIPTTLKDLVHVKDWVVRYGSSVTPATPCTQDSPATALLRANGAIFIAQTTTPEFGWKAVTDSHAYGITRNPHDHGKTTGGSSGGAAAAAFAGAGLFHLGTDGGGSIRIPAAFCGVVGLKPSFGRVPAYPASAFGTVAHIGPIARRTADALAMLKAMSGRNVKDWHQGVGQLPSLQANAPHLRGLKIGYWTKPPVGTLDPEIQTIVDARIAQLATHGMDIAPFELPADDLLRLFNDLWFIGAAARLSTVQERLLATVDPGLLEIAQEGMMKTGVQIAQAQSRRGEFGALMDTALQTYDFILSPATAIPAFEAGHEVPAGSRMKRWTEWAGFSFPINLSQQPAIVLPCGQTKAGLPVALQIIGARGDDAKLLAMAMALEQFFEEPAGFNETT